MSLEAPCLSYYASIICMSMNKMILIIIIRQRPQSRPSSCCTHSVGWPYPIIITFFHLAILNIQGLTLPQWLDARTYEPCWLVQGGGAWSLASWHPPGSSARIIVCQDLPSPGSWGYTRLPHLLRGCTRPHQMPSRPGFEPSDCESGV